MFIALEGIDACGKSIQAKMLADKINADLYSFPDYDTPYGQLILSHLKREWCCTRASKLNGPSHVDAMAFQSLHFTNRLEMQAAIDLSLMETGAVVCDRYLGSALAYGAADGLDWNYLFKVQSSLLQPRYNVLLDISAEDSLARRPERRDRYEDDTRFLRVVSNNYRVIWDKMINRPPHHTTWVAIDGRQTVEVVHQALMALVEGPRKADDGVGRLVPVDGGANEG